jgi:hypothetical protein
VVFCLDFMIGKILAVVFVTFFLLTAFVMISQSYPSEPVEFSVMNHSSSIGSVIEYGAVPVFSENLRFNHNNISYYIDDTCDSIRRTSMIEAFDIFGEKMDNISFYRVSEPADIDVSCSSGFQLSDTLFAAGEGGPSRIINTSFFKTIEKGEIFLYKDQSCDYPIVELHELSHVFGFDHSENPLNIMYNTSNCDQRISQDMVDLINELYSIEPLGDASIDRLSAVKRGRYLDFNITVLNEGLISIEDINLTIFANGEEVTVMEFGEIAIGFGRTLRAKNIRLPSKNVGEIDFVVDYEEYVDELDENNNVLEMVVED